ncbi:hypothetical protein CPB84DRAFT_1757945 [Gymnopilus junonius]|uniref:[RNA-polymerase]-subunit kinase n=1 Tax=Gymnopilus junonius TaxID=109634 RepID=A0A9P5P1M4_GYMJU|nr:hypothetical protein CPB84DRAFT_1757945 [Gymnopilus junonius]
MRQGRKKHSRNNKDVEGDMYMNPPGEDLRTDSYSRSHSSFHVSENYRGPSTSARAPYVSDRDLPSRSAHDDEWRLADLDHNRYSYSDHFIRGERSNYEPNVPINSTGWVPPNSVPYVQPPNNWPRPYDNGVVPPSSYPETSTWGIPPPAPYDSRTSYHDHWDQNNTRDQPPDDWGSESGQFMHRSERRQHEWRGNNQRDKRHGHKFQSDSGWDSRRQDRSTWGNDHVRHQEDPMLEQRHHSMEDRSWEPAASWKNSTNSDPQHQRGYHGSRPSQSKPRRNQNQNKQRREWRADDSDLNNWTRRDINRPVNSKASVSQQNFKRKHLRSPSRSPSRSRSPTESYRSRRSSRGRSRSRSFSPTNKRQRRDSSPVTLRSRTPSERSLNRSYTRQARFPSRSRSPSPNRTPISFVEHRRSPSPGSSSDSERSRSRSPIFLSRSVHRLPTNNHHPVNLASAPGKGTGNGNTVRKKDEKGAKRSNKQYRKQGDYHSRALQGEHEFSRKDDRPSNFSMPPPVSVGNGPPPIAISMPPPPIPPLHVSRSPYVTQDVHGQTSEWPTDSRIDISGKARVGPPKNAGFKPVGQFNSSLKKFFPGDEDEMDLTSEQPLSPTLPTLPVLTSEPHPLSFHGPPLSQPPIIRDSRHFTDRGQHPALYHPPNDFRDSTSYPGSNLPPPADSGPPKSVIRHESTHSCDVPSRVESIVNGHGRSSRTTDTQEPLSRASREIQSSPTDNHESTSASDKDLYKIVSQVGEGTFGKVYKARNMLTGTYVALKRIRMESEKDGFPVTAMREIKLLQSLRHDNVVRLHEMMVSSGSVFMVFEYMDHDLTGVLSQSQFVFLPEHLKSLCLQMLSGLAYLHRKGVIHRDIKGSNILINNRGELKLADFGLARFYQKRRRADYTNRVITLWYRPPELLFGATIYGPEVDMWSAGCIMLELFTKKPVFQGNDEIHQLDVVFKILGTPTPERWADVVNLPWYELVKPQQTIPSRFREAFQKWMSPAALDLAESLLTYDPLQRVTALEAMNSPYFHEEKPAPAPPVGLIDLEGEWHELETKRERARRKERKNTS